MGAREKGREGGTRRGTRKECYGGKGTYKTYIYRIYTCLRMHIDYKIYVLLIYSLFYTQNLRRMKIS